MKHKICMITTRHLPGDPRIFEKESRSLKEVGYPLDIVIPENELPKNTYGINFRTFRKKDGLFRQLHTLIETYKASKSSNADIYHCHEIDASLFVGYLLKKKSTKNVKLIFDSHEFWLEDFSGRVPKVFRWLFQILFILYEKTIIKHCDAIITANSIERGYYQILFPTKEVQIIYNTPHLVQSNNIEKKDRIYDLCYEGVLNFERGQKTLFEMVKTLKESGREIKLLIVGKIQDGECQTWAEEYIQTHNLQKNIFSSGWQTYENINSYLSQGKIGIFLYQHHTTNWLAGPPNKLFNFMKAGLPIIAPDLPETKYILSETGCGLTVTPDNLQEIIEAVTQLLDAPEIQDQMATNGHEAFSKKFNWQIEEKKLSKLYQQVLK